MAWGAIYRTGRSSIIIIERDKQSARKGFTARSYQKALSEGLLPIFDGTRLFQQDNAKIHVCASTAHWLSERVIIQIEWPAHSPDLNPIEYVWKALKQELVTANPHLSNLKKNKAHKAELTECIKKAWAAIPQALITRLIELMPRRLHAVIRARGWYTKY